MAFPLFIAHSLWLPSPQEQRHDLTNTIKALLKDYNKTVSFDPWPDTAELPTCLLGCLPPSHIVGSPVLGLMGSAPFCHGDTHVPVVLLSGVELRAKTAQPSPEEGRAGCHLRARAPALDWLTVQLGTTQCHSLRASAELALARGVLASLPGDCWSLRPA